MVKIKQTKNGLFKLTGLNFTDLEAISVLFANTRLGNGIYEQSAFEIVEAFDNFQSSDSGYALDVDDCKLTVTYEEDQPTIVLTSTYDD